VGVVERSESVTAAIENGGQRLLSRDAARHKLGDIPQTRLAQLERNKQIEVVRDGKRTFVIASSIDDYIERLREASRSQTSETAGD
jgi:hypothetical protein